VAQGGLAAQEAQGVAVVALPTHVLELQVALVVPVVPLVLVLLPQLGLSVRLLRPLALGDLLGLLLQTQLLR